MKKILASGFCALAVATAAAPALIWTWSAFGGAEAGRFETNNDVLSGAAGAYTFIDFSLDMSPFVDVGLISSAWDLRGSGFIRDGTAAPRHFRTGATNGANFVNPDPQGAYNVICIAFGTTDTIFGDLDYCPFASSGAAPSIAAAPPTAPVPGAAGLLVIALGAFGFLRRRG